MAGGVCVHWVVITEARSRYALGLGRRGGGMGDGGGPRRATPLDGARYPAVVPILEERLPVHPWHDAKAVVDATVVAEHAHRDLDGRPRSAG